MDDNELCCIGILLNKCRINCHQCWFANSKHEPTLVNVNLFERIKRNPQVVTTASVLAEANS